MATNRHSATLYGGKVIFRTCDAPRVDISPALSGGLAMPGACGLFTGHGNTLPYVTFPASCLSDRDAMPKPPPRL